MTRHTCAYPATHHSKDITAVFHGRATWTPGSPTEGLATNPSYHATPTYLCGYHSQAAWIAAALKGARR